jgi:hypothetical protein
LFPKEDAALETLAWGELQRPKVAENVPTPVVVGSSISSSRLLFAALATCGGDTAFFRLLTVL